MANTGLAARPVIAMATAWLMALRFQAGRGDLLLFACGTDGPFFFE